MTTLVTGGTGFAGAAAVRELARRGERIAVLSRDAASVAKRFPGLDVEARAGDVTEPSTLTPGFAGIETVINCVQFPNSPIENKRKGWTFEHVDYLGTVHQLEAARDAGVRRFVYVSGVGATLEAAKHWFIFKARAEGAVRASDMTHVIIRPTWLFGPEDVSLNRLLGFARWLPFVPMFGDGQQAMQPLFIDDLGRLLADAAAKPAADNATFEAGGPDRVTMDGVIQAALEVSGKRRSILHQPTALGKGLARILQLLPGPPLTPDSIDFITHPAVADNTEMERVFSPRLTPLREGLATYLGRNEEEGRV